MLPLGAGAADLLGPLGGDAPGGPGFDASGLGSGPPLPRFFPRGDGSDETSPVLARRRPCSPREAGVPTNAPDDPSYVGSALGLSKPSYYGLPPGPGRDDPFGRRPVLRPGPHSLPPC